MKTKKQVSASAAVITSFCSLLLGFSCFAFFAFAYPEKTIEIKKAIASSHDISAVDAQKYVKEFEKAKYINKLSNKSFLLNTRELIDFIKDADTPEFLHFFYAIDPKKPGRELTLIITGAVEKTIGGEKIYENVGRLSNGNMLEHIFPCTGNNCTVCKQDNCTPGDPKDNIYVRKYPDNTN